MKDELSENVLVSSTTSYIEQQSDIKNNRFVFAYKITISNQSDQIVQLLSRHWIIQDANLKIEEIYGEGVIGEQPVIKPGESYSYTSGAILETEIGTMEGRYFLISKPKNSIEDKSLNTEFEISIPKFTLTIPRTLHYLAYYLIN